MFDVDAAVVVDLKTSAVCSLSLFVGLVGTEEVNGRVIVAGRAILVEGPDI